jgi:hypothetical protein
MQFSNKDFRLYFEAIGLWNSHGIRMVGAFNTLLGMD